MSEWTWEYEGYDPAAERLRESLCTLGNGAWVLTRALDLLRHLPAWRREELFERVRPDGGELPRWEEVSRRLRVPYHRGVISQFEGDTVNRYKASKQADVLMLG